MPIKIPNQLPATSVLTSENIFVMTETRAITQEDVYKRQGIHVAAAFPMLCKLLELFNLFDVRLFALCAAGTLLVFCAIYALVRCV